MKPDPKIEKNYLFALILCMAVLLIYPFALRKFFPAAYNTKPAVQESGAEKAPKEIAPMPREVPSLQAPGEEAEAREKDPEIIRYENDLYEVELSTLGASVVRLVYKGDSAHGDFNRSVFWETEGSAAGIFTVGLLHEEADLSQKVFELTRSGKEGEFFKFTYEKPGEYRLIKEFAFGRTDPIVSLDLELENLAARQRHFAAELFVGLKNYSTDKNAAHEFQAAAWTGNVTSADQGKIAKKGFLVTEDLRWAGIVKKYFALLVKPEQKAIAYEARSTGNEILGRMRVEPMDVEAGSAQKQQFFIYAGPQRYETLKSYESGFENLLSRGFFGVVKIWLLKALKFSHQYTHNFGWDIILLTLLIKLLFAPLTHMSYQSMEKMKAIQPKLKAIQERHKKDPSKLNKEMMELYKKHRVNPMGGCLPMLLQIPIFIAFYQVLNETIELKGAPFIGWIHDLSAPDRLFEFGFSIPLLGDAFNLLPILMLGSMFWQQKLTPQAGVSPEQQKIFAFMPLIFGFIFYKMPSGLVLYWFVNNVLSIIQQVFVKRLVGVIHHEDHE